MTVSSFYKLSNDANDDDRWVLSQPWERVEEDDLIRALNVGAQIDPPPAPVRIRIFQSGLARELSFTSRGTFVASKAASQAIERVAGDDVQIIPARVEGTTETFDVINIITVVDCLPETSLFVEGIIPPEKRKTWYKGIIGSRFHPHKIARVKYYEQLVIVTSDFQEAVDNAGFKGVSFRVIESLG